MIKIVDFKMDHALAFKQLNYHWINTYFDVEESDRKMLENPQTYIIDNGGAILIALDNVKVVGTCALVKMKQENTYELAKMAVDESFQKKGIGYLIGKATIEKAKSMMAAKLFLETNSKLGPAIKLYERLGFKEISGVDSPYKRCDVQMELMF